MQTLQPVAVEEKPGRGASTIQFPYTDIEDAISVATALMKGGGIPLSRDQLAAAMDASPTSGSFNTRIGTARTFQVIESKDNKYQLTEIGFEIIDPVRQKAAMVKAFLAVELYRKTYDEFRGKLLPPRPLGLENAFVNFGVTPKQKERARTAFDRSARAAGFFPNGNEDRLVLPFYPNVLDASESEKPKDDEANREAPDNPDKGRVNAPALHKSILGMLDELPAAKSEWSKTEQADWLQALATMFQVIYKSSDSGEVVVNYRAK